MYKKIVVLALLALICVQIACGQTVSKTLKNTADWTDATKVVLVNNRLRGNVVIEGDETYTQKNVAITTSITAGDQSQADSVTVTLSETSNNYVVTVDSSMNPPVVSPSDQLKSSAATALMSVSLGAFFSSFFGLFLAPKMSASSRNMIVMVLVAAFGFSLSSTQSDLSQLRADVNIVLPLGINPPKNFTVSVWQGRAECSNLYLYCNTAPGSYTPPGAQGLIGYWLAEAVYTNGALTTAYNDSSLCTGQWAGCPQGILCTANGIKKMALFSDSVMETRTNAKTSSDFNDRGPFIISGDLVNYTKTESWSCAHPKKVANYSSYTLEQKNYFRFKIENGKLWASNVGTGVPADASKITTWTVYRQISQVDYYGRYFIAICQECASLVGCGGTPPDNCPCKCYSDCQRFGGYGVACPTAKRDITVVEDLQLF